MHASGELETGMQPGAWSRDFDGRLLDAHTARAVFNQARRGDRTHHPPGTPSVAHRRVLDALAWLQVPVVLEHEVVPGVRVDIAVLAQRLAVEIAGPSHYAAPCGGAGPPSEASTKALNCRTFRRQQVVESAGWRVVQLDAQDVDAMVHLPQLCSLLAAMLRDMGVPFLQGDKRTGLPEERSPGVGAASASSGSIRGKARRQAAARKEESLERNRKLRRKVWQQIKQRSPPEQRE